MAGSTAPSTRGPATYVPFPSPPLHASPCHSCGGKGITRRHALMETSEGKPPLLIDIFCPHCDGCGNADHTTCDPGAHANDGLAELMPDYEDGDSGPQCPSCGGLEYAAVQGLPSEGPATDDDMVTLRMPCGLCTTDRAELIELVWCDGQITEVIRQPTSRGAP